MSVEKTFIRLEEEELARPGALETLIEDGCAYLNHGGLGGPPRAIIALRRHAEELCEAQPMRWCRNDAPRLVARARAALCSYLSITDPARLVLLNNASAAVFAVLQAVELTQGDVLLCCETVYHSVGDALRHRCAQAGAMLHTVPMLPPPPVAGEGGAGAVRDEAQLLAAWEGGLRAALQLAKAGGGMVKLAVLDHISSKPALVFPAAAMVAACARHGVPSLVDGAHAPGSLDEAALRLDELGADFYAMNFHKWMHAPRPCAGLYVRHRGASGGSGSARSSSSSSSSSSNGTAWPWIDFSRLTPTVLPPGPLSLSADATYVTDVLTQGHYDESTRDYSHFVVLAACVEVTRRQEARFQRHRDEMVPYTLATLREACGTTVQHASAPDLVPATLCASMATVRLPTTRIVRALSSLAPGPDRSLGGARAVKWAKTALNKQLLVGHGIEVPVFVFRGELYLRVSLPLYVGRSAIARLAAALSSLLGSSKPDLVGGSPAASKSKSKSLVKSKL